MSIFDSKKGLTEMLLSDISKKTLAEGRALSIWGARPVTAAAALKTMPGEIKRMGFSKAYPGAKSNFCARACKGSYRCSTPKMKFWTRKPFFKQLETNVYQPGWKKTQFSLLKIIQLLSYEEMIKDRATKRTEKEYYSHVVGGKVIIISHFLEFDDCDISSI